MSTDERVQVAIGRLVDAAPPAPDWESIEARLPSSAGTSPWISSPNSGPLLTHEPAPPESSSALAHRRTRWLVTAGTIAALVTSGVLAASLISRDRGTDSATVSAATSLPAAAPEAAGPSTERACGVEPPGALNVPAPYEGPKKRASPEAPGAAPEQLVLLWTSGAGSIELRWPPDPSLPNPFPLEQPGADQGPPGRTTGMGAITLPAQQTSAGVAVQYMILQFADATLDGCQFVQVGVFDTDPGRVRSVMERLEAAPFISKEPLVVASETRDFAPEASRCSAPAGAVVPAQRGGALTGQAGYRTPHEALEAFLAADKSLLQRGYREMHLPDGSLAYGREIEGREGAAPGVFVTVVRVAQGPEGWTVTSWESSGC